VGLAKPASHLAAGGLLHHRFSLTFRLRGGSFLFCGAFRRVAPPGRYPAPCPLESGLSSRRKRPATTRMTIPTIIVSPM